MARGPMSVASRTEQPAHGRDDALADTDPDTDEQGSHSAHPLGVLSHYDLVVWYTADDFLTRMPTQPGGTGFARLAVEQMVDVRDYMNEGGKLFFTGQNAGHQYALPTAVESERCRMISPMIAAWFRSPPGEASRTMSPAARLAWSSLPRNQFAAAGPIVPLTNSARRPRLEPSRWSVSITWDVRLGETYWSFQ